MTAGSKAFELKEEDGLLWVKVLDKNVSPASLMEGLGEAGLAISLDRVREILDKADGEWQSVGAIGNRVKVRLSEDKLKAEIYVEPSIRILEQKEAEKHIRKALKDAGVVFGIKEDVLKRLAEGDSELLGIWTVIAEGEAPEECQDAKIEMFVKIAEKSLQEMENAMVVDFKSLGFIPNVKKGALIAKKIPPKEGKDGKDVTGNAIKVRKPKDFSIKAGANTELSDDGLEIRATANGFILKEGNKFTVETVLTVRGDVDYSTGNLECFGSIVVTGGVKEDFSVIAGEDLEIKGVVEGAFLKSGGKMKLESSVRGMERGVIECGGELFLEYADQCKITAGGDIHFKRALMHCEVEAEGSIRLTEGGKGVIAGGELNSGGEVECNVLGSKVGTKTIVRVGVSPRLLKQQRMLSAKKEELDSKITTIKKNIRYLTKLAEEKKIDEKQKLLAIKFIQLLEDLEKKEKEANELLNKVHELIKKIRSKGKVVVKKICYPGVSVFVRNDKFQVREELEEVKFYFDGEVKIASLEED